MSYRILLPIGLQIIRANREKWGSWQTEQQKDYDLEGEAQCSSIHEDSVSGGHLPRSAVALAIWN